MRTFYFSALLVLGLSFFSCDSLDELTEHEFSTTLEADIPVSWNAEDSQFSATETVSLDNSDTHDYLDMLEEINIQKITYQIKNYSCSDCTSVCDAYMNAAGTSVEQIQGFNITEAYQNQTITQVSNTQGFSNIANQLLRDKTISLEYGATNAQTSQDVNFVVEVKLELQITADAL